MFFDLNTKYYEKSRQDLKEKCIKKQSNPLTTVNIIQITISNDKSDSGNRILRSLPP